MIDRSDLDVLSDVLKRHPEALEPLGLFLTPELKLSGYDATPNCCRPFAWTGGDGVHFSLAKLDGNNKSPIVMTVPMNFDAPNMVVGRSLGDFLALGLGGGYFALEGLVYDREAAIAKLAGDFDLDGPARAALKDIRKSFSLVPWSDIRNRLDELQIKYAEALL